MANFVGTWKQFEGSNLDKLAAAMGVPGEKVPDVVKLMEQTILEVTKSGDAYTMKLTTPKSSREVTITPGVESDYTTSTGKKLRTLPKEVGDNKLVQILKNEEGTKEVGQLTSEVEGDILTSTMKMGADMTSVRKFKKQ